MSDRTMEWAVRVSKELFGSETAAEERLKAKCSWEHMTRTAVILEWGDPRDWDQPSEEVPCHCDAEERPWRDCEAHP